jgi:hypothetical protein
VRHIFLLEIVNESLVYARSRACTCTEDEKRQTDGAEEENAAETEEAAAATEVDPEHANRHEGTSTTQPWGKGSDAHSRRLEPSEWHVWTPFAVDQTMGARRQRCHSRDGSVEKTRLQGARYRQHERALACGHSCYDARMIQSATVLDRLLDPFAECLTREAAMRIVELRPDQETEARLDELREKANEGLLTAAEREEYEEFIEGMDLMGILKAKARAALAKLPA